MATTLTTPIFLSKVREAGRTSWTVVKHTCLKDFFNDSTSSLSVSPMAFEPHELKLAVVSAIRIVPNGLQFIPRVPACTTAAFILQPLPKNWNFLVLVFSRIRSKPMWTLGKVDYAWVRPYWYPAFYCPSWTYHLAKGTHQPTYMYLLILGCEWTDRWSRSCSWCWFFENELSLNLSLQPGVQMLNISQSNDPTEKA